MEYKIYVLSTGNSKPPYKVDFDIKPTCLWTDECKWRYLDSAYYSLEEARYYIEKDNCLYHDKKGNVHSICCEPSDELYNNFVKLEYDGITEYYDVYNEENTFKRRENIEFN